MSQRTRARTTGAAPHSPPKPSAPAKESPAQDATPNPVLPIQPEALARTLRAVADEIERDPDLAHRLSAALAPSAPTVGAPRDRPSAATDDADSADQGTQAQRTVNATFRPRLITGASPDLGPGIPDPFALRQRLGAAGLRAALDELRLGSLRAIVREHSLDPSGKLTKQNDAAKLRAAIVQAVRSRD
ncbi:MAG TPA: hypothetical protein VGS80_18910 [Ktedonobacterales bacterium]|nr:hypothetical protein [Ktedonobacterales bacterium]